MTGADGATATRGEAPLQHLREANEQLVLSSLRTVQEMEVALRALADATIAAQSDSLTSLPNRALLQQRFAGAASAAIEHGTTLAVLFVDLDNFKALNDSLGHSVGDELLVHGAGVMEGATRSADTVSRRSGDEFVILLTDVGTPREVAIVVEKLLAALRVPFVVQGNTVVQLSACIGISMFPGDGEELSELLRLADKAMYRAKRRGTGQFVFHGDTGDDDGPALAHERATAAIDARAAEQGRRNAELREANEHLVVAVLSARDLHERAEDAHRRQTEFLSILAHELRTPLAPIRNVSTLLGAIEPGDSTMLRLQGIIERQVQHMSRLIDDLLDVSRIATGKLTLEMRRMAIDEVVVHSIAATQSAMSLRTQQFSLDAPTEPVFILGDRLRLIQVLSNLLDNASKYTPEAGRIELEVRADAAHVWLTVRDTGIGIAPSSLPRIFNLFAQEPAGAGLKSAGLGIGLTVVRELVEAHGGSVDASNRVGGGSEFVVTLPRAVSRLTPETPPSGIAPLY